VTDRHQSTIKSRVKFFGTGLHSGKPVTLDVLPAKAGHGIQFQRTDIVGSAPILATAENITSTALSTTIGTAPVSVSTIEHLMAALVGLGIDNALVRLDGPEVPIMDGSAGPFVDKLLAAGIAKLMGVRQQYVVKKAFEVRDGDKVMRVEPARRLTFRCVISFAGVIGHQALDFTFSRPAFLSLCDSRTFCHEKEVNAMRAMGLALGGSLANAVVVTDSGILNEDGLRSADEFVRHKLLDCIGDLALLGAPLVGLVTVERGGHALHARFMRELLAHGNEYFIVMDVIDRRDDQPAMSDGITAIAAAAAITG
jgi:UDP-3-O-[3-hydroxymyristoyl] N-acetylglucosamine deacetylase